MRRYNKGWRQESERHSLAARHVKTGRKLQNVFLQKQSLLAQGKGFLVPDQDEIWESGKLISTEKDSSGYFEIVEVWRYKGKTYRIGRNRSEGESAIIEVSEKGLASKGSRKELDVFDTHRLRIAKRTLQMPDAIVGVIGGMTKDEARKVIKEIEVKKKPLTVKGERVFDSDFPNNRGDNVVLVRFNTKDKRNFRKLFKEYHPDKKIVNINFEGKDPVVGNVSWADVTYKKVRK